MNPIDTNIAYTLPCFDRESSVPFTIVNDDVEQCDGAYDAFDYYYAQCRGSAFDDLMLGFDDALNLAAKKLSTMNDGDSVGLIVNGEHIIFSRQDCN